MAFLRSAVAVLSFTLLGSIGMGWGLFSFVEGTIDHQLLGIHHVHPGEGQLAWDLGFLALGQIGIGWAAIRAGRADETPRGGLAVGRRTSHA